MGQWRVKLRVKILLPYIMHPMQTLKLRVNDVACGKLIWLLSKFNKDEHEIIHETTNFAKNQKDFNSELNEIRNGKARFVEIAEADRRLENIIKKHEGS